MTLRAVLALVAMPMADEFYVIDVPSVRGNAHRTAAQEVEDEPK
ncbi:MAG: hypothetical protein ACMV0I_08625 [Pseudomonas sp.]